MNEQNGLAAVRVHGCGRWLSRLRLVPSIVALACLAAAGCGQPGPTLPKFDGANAYKLLKAQCDFGPRPPGSAAHDKTRRYLIDELKRQGLTVSEQTFTSRYDGVDYKLANIIAEYKGTSDTHVLLCAHWDTRDRADQELDRDDQKKPILGANDGASGVAVLLDIARVLKESPPKTSVTIVLFDGEDLGLSSKGGMFYGSKYYASNLKKPYPNYGILLDMIGDANLNIPKEYNSYWQARSTVKKVWDAASAAGHGDVFVEEVGDRIADDHIPLLAIGMPCIDVIDFNYAYWHTLKDTPDKCSADSLQAVGDTLIRVIWTEK